MAISRADAEKITNQYYIDIYKYCVARCGNSDDAADIAQEVFLAFAKKAPKLENTNIHSWLFKTASVEIKKYFRLKGKNEFVTLDDDILLNDDMISDDDFSESKPMSEEEFEDLLTKTQKRILAVLTEDEKQLFIKQYIEKKSVRVISDELGITPNYVYVKSHRVKKKAKKVISTLDLIISVLIFKCV